MSVITHTIINRGSFEDQRLHNFPKYDKPQRHLLFDELKAYNKKLFSFKKYK